LRKRIDPRTDSRSRHPRWREAQDVFYAWTRRGYQNKLGSDANIPAMIVAGDSAALRAALKQVSLRSGHDFTKGTFNPRPEKTPFGYRLGTISEHAFGNAIDIDAPHNPQILRADWASLLAFSDGRPELGDARWRRAQWTSRPKSLYDAIAELSGEFSRRLLQARADWQRAHAGVTGEDKIWAGVKQGHRHLAPIASRKLTVWKDGFLALPWVLVEALHEAQFRWGATFPTPDLHHFELLPAGESQ
jgi:hypothetical protein